MKRFLLVFLFAFLLTAPVQSSPMVQVSPVWHKDSNPGVQMKIPTTQDLKLASFKRNGYTYFIFQSSEKLQLDETALQKLPLVRLAHPSALILRGVFSENMQPEFYIQNHTLFLKMGTGGNKESSIDTKWLLNGAFLELNDVGLVEFKDPNTLENFFAFLTPYSPLHMNEKYDTPEISFLPTYQGFVIYSKTSDFHVQKVKTGYVIYPQNENSIALANESVTDFESINWNAYTNLSAQKINNEIQNLKSFILYVASGSKERMHFEMAQLYLSQGLPAPALDILANMPESNNKAKLNFLALILANNPAQALKQWNEITEHSPTLNLWKNTIDDEKLLSTEDFEKINLSPAMAFVFWKNLAQKATRENNIPLLSTGVDKLSDLPLNDYQKQALIYFAGQLAEKENNIPQAVKIYETAEKLPLSEYSAQILFSKIKAQIKTHAITIDNAIFELEKMRHLVSSTDLEIPLLQTLSALYNQKNDLVQALHTERQILSIMQDDAILKRMQQHFEHFFMTAQKHIDRVALYNEFKELMPTGAQAIQIKQQLLDDFIALDLLDKAYDLAMELAQTTTEQTADQSALYAYLIASLLNDTEKMSQANEYLPNNWQELSPPDNMPEILKWTYGKIR